MNRKSILLLTFFIIPNLAYSSDANMLLRVNLFLNDIYLTHPNISYGIGGNYEIYKNLQVGAELTFLNVQKEDEGYGIGANGQYNLYKYNIKESYFLPEINFKYFFIKGNSFRFAISIGDQITYKYYYLYNLTIGNETGEYTIKEIRLINNSIKISVLAVYKIINHFSIEIQPFYMKNTKLFNYDRTNYGFQFGILYNFK